MNDDQSALNPVKNVIAVIVTYQPDLDVLKQLLEALVSQVSSTVIVDNASSENIRAWNEKHFAHKVEVLTLEDNKGIAVAHNRGIQWARERHAEFVLIMDQDSIPALDMVSNLTWAISKVASPAAVGPRYIDDRQDNPLSPFVQIRGLLLKRSICEFPNSIIPVDFLISSGCLIPMSVLDKIGGMREELFIDYVDTEWIWRARHHGFLSYGICSAHMRHSLGDNPVALFGKNITLRSTIRHYYLFRNAVLLYKESWIPLNWKLADFSRLAFKYVLYSFFAKPRLSHWRMMTLGLWHGLLGRSGKYSI